MDEGCDGIAATVEPSAVGMVDELVPGAHPMRANVSAAKAATAPPAGAYFADRIEAWRIPIRG